MPAIWPHPPLTPTSSRLRGHGTVDSCKLATDRDSGATKGFGFIEMNKDDEAQAAISALDGSQLGGNAIRVNVSTPKPQVGDARG